MGTEAEELKLKQMEIKNPKSQVANRKVDPLVRIGCRSYGQSDSVSR